MAGDIRGGRHCNSIFAGSRPGEVAVSCKVAGAGPPPDCGLRISDCGLTEGAVAPGAGVRVKMMRLAASGTR